MDFWRYPLILGFMAAWFGGWKLYVDWDLAAMKEREARSERGLADLSIPPKLNDRMAAPNWSIAKWMDVDRKDADCATADEYMDQGIASKTVTRRGHGRTRHLSEYVESCQNRVQRMLNYVEPSTRKWCAYRRTDQRLETLCREWEQHKEDYIVRIGVLDGPTLARYARITSSG